MTVGLGRILGHMGAGIEQEVRLAQVLDKVQIQPLAHALVAVRADVEAAPAQAPVEGVGPGLERPPGDLAGGDHMLAQVLANAQARRRAGDLLGPARGVGQDHAALAQTLEFFERRDGVIEGLHAIVEHAPQIEDVGVEVLCDLAQAGDLGRVGGSCVWHGARHATAARWRQALEQAARLGDK